MFHTEKVISGGQSTLPSVLALIPHTKLLLVACFPFYFPKLLNVSLFRNSLNETSKPNQYNRKYHFIFYHETILKKHLPWFVAVEALKKTYTYNDTIKCVQN